MGRVKRVATPSTPLTNLPILACDGFEQERSLVDLVQIVATASRPLTNLFILTLDGFEKVCL